MPDILIRGLSMPKETGDLLCINIHPNGNVTINLDLECKPVAKAVELPPHGDLIDRDKIRYTELYGGVEVTAANRIDSLPVVVPAERREG